MAHIIHIKLSKVITYLLMFQNLVTSLDSLVIRSLHFKCPAGFSLKRMMSMCIVHLNINKAIILISIII